MVGLKETERGTSEKALCPLLESCKSILLPLAYSSVFVLGLLITRAKLRLSRCRAKDWTCTTIYLVNLAVVALLYPFSLPLLINYILQDTWPLESCSADRVSVCYCLMIRSLTQHAGGTSPTGSATQATPIQTVLLVCGLFAACLLPFHTTRSRYLFIHAYQAPDCNSYSTGVCFTRSGGHWSASTAASTLSSTFFLVKQSQACFGAKTDQGRSSSQACCAHRGDRRPSETCPLLRKRVPAALS